VVVSLFAVVMISLQVAAQGSWGFHRDEFLYLAMARRVAWGYWSNPPLIGVLAWIAENVTGTSLFSVRLLPLAASVGTMLLTASIARDLGGRIVATAMACIPFVVSPGLLRTGGMFQPVVFDVLLWTAMASIGVRYIRTTDPR
jgi:4-amino-4-deoxy-L-arabinose transferase-like glycosyltransferase